MKKATILLKIKKYLKQHKSIDYEKAYRNELSHNETLSNDMRGLDSKNRLKIADLNEVIKDKDETIQILKDNIKELKKKNALLIKTLKENNKSNER